MVRDGASDDDDDDDDDDARSRHGRQPVNSGPAKADRRSVRVAAMGHMIVRRRSEETLIRMGCKSPQRTPAASSKDASSGSCPHIPASSDPSRKAADGAHHETDQQQQDRLRPKLAARSYRRGGRATLAPGRPCPGVSCHRRCRDGAEGCQKGSPLHQNSPVSGACKFPGKISQQNKGLIFPR